MLKLKASIGQSGNDEIGGGRRFVYLPTIVGAYGTYWGTSHTIPEVLLSESMPMRMCRGKYLPKQMSVLNCLYSMLYVYRPIIFTKDGKVFLFNGSRYPIMSGYLPCRGPMSERCRIRESMQRSNSIKVSVSFSCRPGEPLRMPATNKSITINPIISINTGTGTDKNMAAIRSHSTRIV